MRANNFCSSSQLATFRTSVSYQQFFFDATCENKTKGPYTLPLIVKTSEVESMIFFLTFLAYTNFLFSTNMHKLG